MTKPLGIRESVKKGLMSPGAALEWLRAQEYVSPRLKAWLERKVRA